MKTYRYRLLVDATATPIIERTFVAYAAMRPILDSAPVRSRHNVVEMNQAAYDAVRAKTGLPSRLIQNGIREYAARVWSQDRLPLDDRLFSVKGLDRVSIATVGEGPRLVLGMVFEGYDDALSERPVFSHLVREPTGFYLVALASPLVQDKDLIPMNTETVASRVTRVATGLVNTLVSAIEERSSSAVAEQAIRDMGLAIRDARQDLASAVAERKRYQMQRREHETERSSLEEKIVLALKVNNETAAKAGAEREHDLTDLIAGLDRQISEVGERIAEIEASLRTAEAARRDACQRVEAARRASREAISNGGGSRVQIDLVSRMEEALGAVDRTTGSTSESGRNAGLDELDDLVRDQGVERRLAELRRRVGDDFGND